jgi:cell division protease FtsH
MSQTSGNKSTVNPEPIAEVDKKPRFPLPSGDSADDPGSQHSDETRKNKPRPNGKTAVVGAAFDAAFTPTVRRSLRHGKALAVVVQVPAVSWVEPVAQHFKSVFGDRWMIHSRDGSNSTVHKSTVGSSEIARELACGLCVVGIAADTKLLPEALTAVADITIRIAAPRAKVMRKAITRFARRSPGDLDDGVAAGLGLHEIVACFRPGTGPNTIAQRLAAAAAKKQVRLDRVPDLETAVEYGEARTWGLDLARDIADYRAGKIAWRDVDRGICLHSQPGLGKSLFSQVLARACGVQLVSASIGELFASSPGYLDSVIKAMRATFAQAAALAPCVLLLDEIDALPNRATMSNRGRDWWSPVIADFLIHLDSAISQREGIVVVGATNAIEQVDAALLRPGRLEKAVEIKRPELAGTINILKFHLNEELTGDLSEIGGMMEGSTGAEIMHAVRSARRIARHEGRPMRIDDLKRAVLPLEEISPSLLFRMTIHEAAHAVAAVVLQVGELKHVVLRSKGTSGGQTFVDFSEFALSTRTMIEDRVVVGLAARAAERHFTGAASTATGGGADSDLAGATTLIAALHASFGLGGELAYLGAVEDLQREICFNIKLRDQVEQHLRELDARATELVENNHEAIFAVAERLASRRFLSGSQVVEIVRGRSGAAASELNEPNHRNSDKEVPC